MARGEERISGVVDVHSRCRGSSGKECLQHNMYTHDCVSVGAMSTHAHLHVCSYLCACIFVMQVSTKADL